MKTFARTLAALLALLFLAQTADAKVALLLRRSYADGATATKAANVTLQALTPILEMGGVNYQVYYVEDLGATESAQLTYICDTMDDSDGVTVAVWIGGSQNDASGTGPWVTQVTKQSQSYSPDIPMIWATNDYRMFYPQTGANRIRTGVMTGTGYTSNIQVIGGGGSVSFPSAAARAVVEDTLVSEYATLESLTHVPGQPTQLFAWRLTGASAPFTHGWSYLLLPMSSSTYPIDTASANVWNEYSSVYWIAAEIAHWAPSEWRRDRPIYWSIEADDELTSAGYSYSTDASTDRDWHDTPSLQQLADSLTAWADGGCPIIMNIGVNPESVATSEGIAKEAIYNGAARNYFNLSIHDHTVDPAKRTTVATMEAAASTALDSMNTRFDRASPIIWPTGGQMGTNFYTTMTPDSVATAMLAAGVSWIRNVFQASAGVPALANAWDPDMNSWLRMDIGGKTFTWIRAGSQTSVDTTACCGGQWIPINRRQDALFVGQNFYQFAIIHHVPSFSYGYVSPGVYLPAGITICNMNRTQAMIINRMAGRQLVAFSKAQQVAQNFYYRPRRAW